MESSSAASILPTKNSPLLLDDNYWVSDNNLGQNICKGWTGNERLGQKPQLLGIPVL